MTVAEYGLYSHLREVSAKHGFHYIFDDRKIASRFLGRSYSTFNRLRNQLAAKGFIQYLSPQHKGSNGRFEAQEGRILSHDEWVELYPNRCQRTGNIGETGDSPVTQVRPAPVTQVLHKSINPKSIKHDAAADPPGGVFNTQDRTQAAGSNVPPVTPVLPVAPTVSDTPLVARLAELLQSRTLMKQAVDSVEGIEHLERQPFAQIEKVLTWALDEPFWAKRIVGMRALRTFVRNYPTIQQQMNAEKKSRSKLAHNIKAASCLVTGEREWKGEQI